MLKNEIVLPEGKLSTGPAALLRSAWQWVGALPLVVQVAVWVLLAVVLGGPDLVIFYLPVVIGLWFWETLRPSSSARLLRLTGNSKESDVQNPASRATKTDMGQWIRHLAEMVVAMYAGMLVYHMLFTSALTALGFGYLFDGDLGYAWMTLFMVVPMVALMRFQGHTWRMGGEMAFGMVVPIIVCFGLVRLGICPLVPFLTWLSDTSVYRAAHDGMLLGMIAVMVYRREMYADGSRLATTHGQHGHHGHES